MTTLLEVRDLVKHFPSRSRGNPVHAVENVSFDLARGESLGLVGESGSGKSTIARLVVGLETPSSGSIRLDGAELAHLSHHDRLPYRRRVQMIFQDPHSSLDPRQTVASIVAEPLAIHRIGRPRERRLRVLALLEAVGLSAQHANRLPHEFSGGQRQRIGIARALALEPDLLICDEPVSALDVSIQAQIVNLLKDLQHRFGLAYLFIAHDLAVVRNLCPRIAVLYLGRIVEIATRESLFASPQHPYTRALLSAIPIADPTIERARTRIVLHGDPPSPAHPPSGCPFHPRCVERAHVPDDRCLHERPDLLPRTQTSRSACHLP